MAKEIERRFLVTDASVLAGQNGFPIVQGYLVKDAMTVRIRTLGQSAFLTLKGPRQGGVRDEFEYAIPFDDALNMLHGHCAARIVCKTRYLVPHGRHIFEVDVFSGRHTGLVVAEVELAMENEEIDLPPWVGAEITDWPHWGNYALAQGAGLPQSGWRQ